MTKTCATGSANTRLRIRVAYAGHPPSVNKTMRQHGRATATVLDPWLQNALFAARQYTGPPATGTSLVRVSFPVPDNTRRDASNYVGTVCKYIIDGIVKAGTVWGDDTAREVVGIDPRIVVIPGLNDPTTGLAGRANALVDIVPLSRLLSELRFAPELHDLFSPKET